MSSSSIHDLQIIEKKIETGQHYFTKEELDAIWWDGYEHGYMSDIGSESKKNMKQNLKLGVS